MTRTTLLLLAALAAAPLVRAADPVIDPEVARQPLRLPRLPNKDFEAALFTGTYATQNFGSAAVLGLRLGYHLSEDFFVQGSYGRSRVSDEAFRQVLPGGVFPHEKETLQYAHLALGWNLLPGEAFVGRGIAKAGALYLLGGVGSTHFVQQRRQTLVIGAGGRLLLRERFALQLDLRDHLFSLDLLGRRERTQNLEATLGAAWHF
ncbi:MAG: outer membrane beta-barrel domain-containing protein [Rubrivivax sp.]